MTLKVYIGSASEITARLAGAPSSTTTTIAAVTSATVFDLTSATSFSEGDPITVNREKRIIQDLTGTTVTLDEALSEEPTIGDTVKHYDADYSGYRDQEEQIAFLDDRQTGGNTGNQIGQKQVTILDRDSNLAAPTAGNRISIFESIDPTTPLFAGVIVTVQEAIFAKQSNGLYAKAYTIDARGYQWEADGVGIEEEPQVNVNAGDFLRYLMGKYTTLTEGSIDVTNSPTINFIRIGNFRRFTEVGQALASLWPGSEFFIANTHTGGQVYFRQQVATAAPITLDTTFLDKVGANNVLITKDHTRTFNRIRLPFYMLQRREPDFFVQSTVSDAAFLKTSVLLNGQPTNVEESDLFFDDFADGDLNTDFTEDDLTNASPPTGFVSADGYLVEGAVNSVQGLHLLDTTASSPSYGDIGRVTDPGEIQPFTGEERQMLFAKEIVVNTLGDAIIMGILDQSTVTTTAASGSTSSKVYVSSVSGFSAGDRLTISSQKTYITTVGANYFDISPSLSGAPSAGTTVTKHRLAKSRIKFAVEFTAAGDLKYIKNGVSTAFGTPRTYTTATYSLRAFMQAFETTVSASPTSTGCVVTDGTNFAVGDVIEIFTQGARKDPEKRVILTKTAGTGTLATLTWAATSYTPSTGYRVRTLPKIVLQVKGGAYGSITGRTWTTLYTATNTWQTSASADLDAHGVVLCLHKSLVGTITFFQMKNPVGVTANIGSRYLFIGTQEVDTSEADVDCIIRKVGSHYQIDFFPDTKSLWSSGSTLECRYFEKFRNDLEESDLESMKAIARLRGQTLTGSETQEQLTRMGAITMDTVEILPNPITLLEAVTQSKALLDAVKDPAVTVEINTNTHLDTLCRAGQIIPSSLPGIDALEIKQVTITEYRGAMNADGGTLYQQNIIAGSIDRLSDVLLKRQLRNGSRLTINDGFDDDSFTLIQKTGFQEIARTSDDFQVATCSSPTQYLYDGTDYTLLKCLQIPVQ